MERGVEAERSGGRRKASSLERDTDDHAAHDVPVKPELDVLTCRLVQQRFVYRPSTDRYGRPIADQVEGEHEWVARGR